jgi:phosphoribosylformylglycinamidine synthase
MCAGNVGALRDTWESTSFALERLQASAETVAAEQAGLAGRQAPNWALPWTPAWTPDEALSAADKPRVAVLRSAEPFASVHALPSKPAELFSNSLLACIISGHCASWPCSIIFHCCRYLAPSAAHGFNRSIAR